MHKVQTPYLIHTLWLEQLLFSSCWQSFLSPTANIKLQGRIDPIYPFVIPTVAHRSNPMITLPEANGRVFEIGRASCREGEGISQLAVAGKRKSVEKLNGW